MDSDVSPLDRAAALANLVCTNYQFQTSTSADEKLLWKLSKHAGAAIECLISNKKADYDGFAELCKVSANTTQIERVVYVISTLLIQLLIERKPSDAFAPPNQCLPNQDCQDGVVAVKEEAPDDAQMFEAAPIVPETIVKEEPIDDDDWKFAVQSTSSGLVKVDPEASDMELPEAAFTVKAEPVESPELFEMDSSPGPSYSHPSTSRISPRTVKISAAPSSLRTRPIPMILPKPISIAAPSLSKVAAPAAKRYKLSGGAPTPAAAVPNTWTEILADLNKQMYERREFSGLHCTATDGSTLVQLGTVNNCKVNQIKTKCDYCDYSSFSTMALHSHIRNHHSEHFERLSHACWTCDFRTMDPTLLRAHRNWFHCKLCLVEVSLCEKSYHNGSAKKSEAAKKRKEGPLYDSRKNSKCRNCELPNDEHTIQKCHICKQPIPSCITLEAHWNIAPGAEFACLTKCGTNEVCDFRSRNMGALRTLEKSHSTFRIVHDLDIDAKCPYCPKPIGTALQFNSHMLERHKTLLHRTAAMFRCNGENPLKDEPCTFKSSRIFQMVTHWETKEHSNFQPSIRFDYEIAKKGVNTAPRE